MNKIGIEYGKWLGQMDWNYLATIRPHYSISPIASDRMMRSLIKYQNIDRIFYALEKDRNCNMNHVHLMLKTNNDLDGDNLAKQLHLNPKAVGYFDEVNSPEAISFYCTKNITKSHSHYDLLTSY